VEYRLVDRYIEPYTFNYAHKLHPKQHYNALQKWIEDIDCEYGVNASIWMVLGITVCDMLMHS